MDDKENNVTENDIRIAEIEQMIREFKEKLRHGTSDSENFITIHEIERLWGELLSNTQNIYLDMVRDVLSTVNERDLIRKKKENTSSKE